jgi:hypothetical protein
MPPKAANGVMKRAVVTTLPPNRKRKKSFFEEFYYPMLFVEFLFVSLLFGAGGMGFSQGIMVGLLVTAITAVAWQFFQYARFKDDPNERPKLQAKLAPAPPKKEANPNPDFIPIRPAPRKPAPIGPDGKKVFPPSYFPPLRDRKPLK